MILEWIFAVYKVERGVGIQQSSYGVGVAHGTLNPLAGVRISVGAALFLYLN